MLIVGINYFGNHRLTHYILMALISWHYDISYDCHCII